MGEGGEVPREVLIQLILCEELSVALAIEILGTCITLRTSFFSASLQDSSRKVLTINPLSTQDRRWCIHVVFISKELEYHILINGVYLIK